MHLDTGEDGLVPGQKKQCAALMCPGFLTGQSLESLSRSTTPADGVVRGKLLEAHA